MYGLLRNVLFLLPPETSHHIALSSLSLLAKLKRSNSPIKSDQTPIKVMGINFPNRIGLAAGLDKNGEYIDGLAALGFGFIEIGTVTPRPQPGNPQPRLFRLPASKAIINRMGFNNQGIDYLLEQVQSANYQGVLGINIGKNFDTPVEEALDDYLIGLEKAYPHADYITINISSPNTPGLRQLQYGKELQALLTGIKQEQSRLTEKHERYVPIAVKVAPDLTEAEIKNMADIFLQEKIDALIATNTTLSRETVQGQTYADEKGGLSGEPVKMLSTAVIQHFRQHLGDQIPIIGVGGIASVEDAKEKLDAGADLVQIYTGFIYEGPSLVNACAKKLVV